ncbi:endonuclease domain-containing 1 protein-like [Acipenser ruthenus]|uniref:endonuclease domain-containing 1 protein-like n=1 Tax=Acipenser ruthenus TaxID=7906 RepID=UPI0027410F7E|nr:endonuclease domain-containing 1 protein-like [Acipenser ruthenus]XP_058871585.1 endonuclease domain-containing 1 protein-like [Acipenser ruthenus]
MMGFVCGVFLLLTLPALARTEVVNDFKVCKDFFLESKAPTVQLDQNRYKRICQKYKNKYEFATLYDTTNRIPVYSAYTYSDCDEGERKKRNWAIEPQLDLGSGSGEMALENTVKGAGGKQALDKDYKTIEDSNTPDGYNRGHLFPVCHAESQSAKDATFTLTNIVPQNVEFNGGAWASTERFVRDNIKEKCTPDNNNKAYIVTGAVPSKNSKVNNRVNIPEYMWTAFCCKKDNRWVSMAHYGRNAKGEVTVPVSLEKLEEQLKTDYDVKSFLVFGGNCYEVKATYFDYAMRFFRYLNSIIRG